MNKHLTYFQWCLKEEINPTEEGERAWNGAIENAVPGYKLTFDEWWENHGVALVGDNAAWLYGRLREAFSK